MGDSTFQIQSYPPAIAYATEDVQPPTALAVSANDQLIVDMICFPGRPLINIFARLLLPDSSIVPMQWQVVAAISDQLITQAFPLADGFLLSLVITTNPSAVQRGNIYARVRVFRGSLGQAFSGLQLCAGYVSSATPLAWPGGIQGTNYEGYGAPVLTGIAAPGAGVDFSVTASIGVIWHLESLVITFTTSAAVANRFPTIQLQDSLGNVAYAVTVPAALTAGKAYQLVISPAPYAGGTGANVINLPWPPLFAIQATWVIASITTGIQAGDTWTFGNLYTEEYLQP